MKVIRWLENWIRDSAAISPVNERFLLCMHCDDEQSGQRAAYNELWYVLSASNERTTLLFITAIRAGYNGLAQLFPLNERQQQWEISV